MKKKIISILLLVTMMVTGLVFTGCSKGEENPLIGTWDAVSYNINGMDMSSEEVGMTFTLVFKEDGKVDAITNGSSDGTADWELTDDGFTVTSAGIEMPGYIDDEGVMHFTMKSATSSFDIILEKQQ